MNLRRIFPTVVLWLLAAATPAWCQSPASGTNLPGQDSSLPKAYVQAGLLASLHPEGTPIPRISPTVHGVAPGAVVAGGVRLSRAVALEIETVFERTLTTPLVFIGSSSSSAFEGAVRDVLFGANLRLRPGRNRLEFQVGGGVAVSRYSNPLRPPALHITRRQGQLGAGVAVAWRLGAAMTLAPTAVYRWVNRPDPASFEGLGTSRHSVHIGVVVRR